MADIARLVIHFEGDTSSLDKAYARAKKAQTDFVRDANRQGSVALDADTRDLDKKISEARRTISDYKKAAGKESGVTLDADEGPLQRAVKNASGTLSRFRSDAAKNTETEFTADDSLLQRVVKSASGALSRFRSEAAKNTETEITGDESDLLAAVNRAKASLLTLSGKNIKLGADTSGVDRAVSNLDASLSKFSSSASGATKDSDRFSGSIDRMGAKAIDSGGGINGLAKSIHSISTVTAAAAGLPALVAAIGALPAVALAAAGATAQLALGLGQGLAGAAAIGGAALIGAAGALRAYKALIGSTITASRELYLAENAAAQKRIDAAKKTAFSTKANMAFNRSLDGAQIAFIKLQGAVSDKAFPFFTREIRAWTNLFPKFQGEIVKTAGGLAAMAAGFSKWIRNAQQGKLLGDTLDFINGSAMRAGATLSHLGRAGVLVFQHLIGPATKLQKQILGVASSMDEWVQSTEGAKRISSIVDVLQKRFYQLLTIVKNVGSGLIGVFAAINNTGGPARLMKGLVNLSQGFANLLQKGNGARQAIVRFMRDADPLLNQTWKLVKTLVIQFGLLANNIIKAGQSGGRMGTLAKVMAGLRKSVVPLRKMFEGTFKALGPVLAALIPQAVKFLTVFLGSSGPLKSFLQAMTGILRVFNALPGPVKTTIANIVALKVILGGLGFGAVASSVGRFASNMFLASRSAGKVTTALKAQAGVTTATTAATTTAGAATATTASRFSRMGTAVKAAGAALLGVAGIASGGILIALAALAAAGYLIYRNWGRITKAVQPATKAIGGFFEAIRPVMVALRGAFAQALGALARGFISAVFPTVKLGSATHSLSQSFAVLAKAAIPPTINAIKALTNFIEGHQGAFRLFGKIVGTVLVGSFKALTFGIRIQVKIISLLVKAVGGLVNVFRGVASKINSVKLHPFDGLVKAWKSLDLKWEGSALQKLYKKITGGADDTKKKTGSTFKDLKGNLGNIFSDIFKGASNWWSKIASKIGDKSEESKKKSGDRFRDLWNNLKNIWGDVFKAASNWWDKVAKKVSDKSDESKKHSGDRFRELWDNLKNIWSSVFKAASNWWDKVSNKVSDKSDESKKKSGDRFRELWDNLKNIWSGVFTAASNWFDKVASKIGDKSEEAKSRSGDRFRELLENSRNIWGDTFTAAKNIWSNISDTVRRLAWDIFRGVSGAWNALESFVKGVLSRLGISSGSGSSSGSSSGGSSGGSGGGGGGSAGSGGSISGIGPGGGLTGHAKGGVFKADRGGIAGPGRMGIVGEAGDDEAIVNLKRYTDQSAMALRKANEAWAEKGWIDRTQRTHRHRDEDMSRRGGRKGQGEGVSPVTLHKWAPEISGRVHSIASATGTVPNTYPGHGEPGGSTQGYTADFWGSGGRGSPISKGAAYETANLALSKYNSNPGVLYIIRQGEYWRDGNWGSNTYGDPHYDHTHISWVSPFGTAGAGSSGPSAQEIAFEKAWSVTAQPLLDAFSRSMEGGFVLRQAAAGLSQQSGASVHDTILQWIREKFGGSGMSNVFGDTVSGAGVDTMKGATGPAGVPTDWASDGSLWYILNRENGTTPQNIVWDNPANSSNFVQPFNLMIPNQYNATMSSPKQERLSAGLKYIRDRYDNPDKAAEFHKSHNWYARGGIIPGSKGKPVMIQAHAGERVLPERMVKAFDKLARSIEKWAKDSRQHRSGNTQPFGVEVNRRGVFTPGLSVTRRGVDFDPQVFHRSLHANEDTARTLRRVEKRLRNLDKDIGKEVREGVNKNFERGLRTARSMDASDARRLARKLAGGARIARAL